jgi:hypothetical protein
MAMQSSRIWLVGWAWVGMVATGGGLPGQETIERPVLEVPKLAPNVHVPDAGFVRHRSHPIKTSREVLAAQRIEDRRCSKTVVDGVTTIDVIHDNQPLQMVIYPGGRIEITEVRSFSADNADELRESYPDLIMDFNSFPKTVEPNSRVRLNLQIETIQGFSGPVELETNRPDLHRVYLQHTRPPQITWSK